jgi:ribosomal protein S18 acetylase RimI-like enzyme
VIPDLPDGWSGRAATLDDVPSILEVLVASDIAAIGEPDSTTELVVEILTAPNAEAVVAFDPTGRMAGFGAMVNETRSDRDNIEVYVHPDGGQPAIPALLHWGLAQVARRAREWGRPRLTARVGLIPSETALVEAVTAAGFQFVKRYARMRVELPAPVEPVLPTGVTIRPFRHDDPAERQTWHDILMSAFADTPDFIPSTPEDWWGKTERPAVRIDWDEWWLALVDGQPAGLLQSDSLSIEQDEGWVKNLAVLRAYRGRGIGRALLATAFAAYTAKGRKRAGLGVDLTNPTGAYDLYRAVGMRPAFEADMYELVVAG